MNEVKRTLYDKDMAFYSFPQTGKNVDCTVHTADMAKEKGLMWLPHGKCYGGIGDGMGQCMVSMWLPHGRCYAGIGNDVDQHLSSTCPFNYFVKKLVWTPWELNP